LKNIKKLTLLALTLFITSIVLGQNNKGKKPSKEKVKAMKVGYITEKLNLTTEEAQRFWPIYNEFDAKMDENRKSLRKIHKKDVTLDEMTDADAGKMVDTHMALRQSELDIQKEYHAKFKTVLSIKKVAKLYKAEQDFKRDLLKKIKNHKGGDSKGHRGPPPGGGRH